VPSNRPRQDLFHYPIPDYQWIMQFHVEFEIPPRASRISIPLLPSKQEVNLLHKIDVSESKPRVSDRITRGDALFPPIPFGRDADLPEGPDVVQLERISIADCNATRPLHGAR